MTLADFSGADLSDAVAGSLAAMRGKFVGTNFTGADLEDARFVDADLSGANLENADLSGADLVGTDFGGANLKGANLTAAKLGLTPALFDQLRSSAVFAGVGSWTAVVSGVTDPQALTALVGKSI